MSRNPERGSKQYTKIMKTNDRNFWVFDNEGETFDRYTIILYNGEILGASEFPFSAQGFGQHCGNWIDSYFTTTFGAAWRDYVHISAYKKRQILDEQLSMARKEGNLGKEIIDISLIPADVLKFIHQNL
jgi:hypothetical protein